jgi:hypothetical protein
MRTQLVLFAMGAVTLVMLDAIGGGDGEADVTDDGCDVAIDDRDGDAVSGDCGMGVIGGDGGMDVIGG